MRPVSGFERPAVQWIFFALAIVLIAIVAAEAAGLWRARRQIESLRAADLNARVQQEQLERRLAREGSTREALSLELARLRGGGTAAIAPSLTLAPLTTRSAKPPDATVAQPPATQMIQLRLLLPPGRVPATARYSIALRTWSGGDTIWSRSGLPSTVDGKPMVAAFVTGDIFAAGAYEVNLTASPGGEIASYELAVGPAVSR